MILDDDYHNHNLNFKNHYDDDDFVDDNYVIISYLNYANKEI